MSKQLEGKKIKKTRVVIGIVCIVMAAIMIFAGLPIAVNLATKTVPVLVATRNIGRGEKISSDNSSVVMMGQENLPETVLSSLPLANTPLYAKMEIAANGMIMTNNTTKTKGSIESLTNLPDGKVAISFTFGGPAASFDNQFQVGDIVQFLCYYNANSYYASEKGTVKKGEGTVESNDMLKYVKLYSVNNEYGTEIENSQRDEVRYTHATVIVTQRQAEEIVRLEHEGMIHLSLIYRYDGGTENKSDSYIAAQDAYLAKLEKQANKAK